MPTDIKKHLSGQKWGDTKEFVPPVLNIPADAYGPDELNYKMTVAEFEHEHACKEIMALEVAVTIRTKKTMIIIGAHAWDMLQNKKLAEYLQKTFEEDPKFRLTKDLYDAFIHIEHQELFDKYNYYEKLAKHAKDTHEMLQKQLGWYQSIMKREVAELTKTG